jgi:hypothetical protein
MTSSHNATAIFTSSNKKSVSFDCNWNPDGSIDEAADLADAVYFSDPNGLFVKGEIIYAKVELKSDPSVKREIHFDDAAGIIYSMPQPKSKASLKI